MTAGVASAPPPAAGSPILSARGLSVSYGPRGSTRAPSRRWAWVRGYQGPPAAAAVNAVDIDVPTGRCLGLVGESGSGKTTLGSCLAGLLPPTTGEIRYCGELVSRSDRPARLPRVKGVQVVFQDPASSLNPRRTIRSLLTEVLRVHRLGQREELADRCDQLVGRVGLPAAVLERRAAALSGGQRQRVAIARALAFEPAVLVADEVVSALDASVQAQVLNLLADLRDESGMTILLITHDLAVVNQLCDDVAVMSRGEIVESGSRDDVLLEPQHPYTRDLLRSVPRLAGAGLGSSGFMPAPEGSP